MSEYITSPLIESVRVADEYGKDFEAIMHIVYVTNDIVYIVGLLSVNAGASSLIRQTAKRLIKDGVKEVRYFRYKNGVRKEIIRKARVQEV